MMIRLSVQSLTKSAVPYRQHKNLEIFLLEWRPEMMVLTALLGYLVLEWIHNSVEPLTGKPNTYNWG